MDYQTQLDWLVTMAQHPGFKDHAWFRTKQLETDFPGIKQALTRRMTGLASGTASEGQKNGKRHLTLVK